MLSLVCCRMRRNERSVSDTPDVRERVQNAENKYNFKIGIYGWRKRCLYVLILGLLIVVIINLALTLWVLKVMEFSSEGMGQLKIITNGIRVDGKVFVMDRLIASTIKSRPTHPIVIESAKNFTLSTRNRNGRLENLMFIGNPVASPFRPFADLAIV